MLKIACWESASTLGFFGVGVFELACIGAVVAGFVGIIVVVVVAASQGNRRK